MLAFLFTYWPIIAAVTGAIGVGGIVLLLVFWPVVASFLIGTRVGRMVSAVGAAALIVLFAFVAGKRKGAQGERAGQRAANLRIAKKRIKTDASIRKLAPAARRKRLDKWVRG